jgi:ABC-2 type transport system ATP-binding protein
MTVVHLQGVTKRFGRTPALLDVDLRFEAGVTVVVGPKGSGKTTMCEIVAGWRPCDEGRVLFPQANGSGPPRVELAAQQSASYLTLSVADNLLVFAQLAGLHGRGAELRIAAVAERFGLAGLLNRPVGTLPDFLQRHVHVASALLGDPPVLLLDEPTEGLDLQVGRDLLAIVGALADGGRTVVHATRHAAEIEPLAPGRVVVLDGGRVRYAGPPAAVDLPGCVERTGPARLQLLDRERENVPAW